MPLIKRFGEMWARNKNNLAAVPRSKDGGQGVYILYDGSMPVYIGMGNIRSRIKTAGKSRLRGQMWDHFSWYIPSDPTLMRDIEALLLRMLPFYLRILNRQGGKLRGAEKKEKEHDHTAEPISRKLPPRISRRKKQSKLH